MVGQVIEIVADGNYLSKYRGFILVKNGDVEIGRVPLDDVTAVLLAAHQITLSKTLLMELGMRNVPVITCGTNYHPIAISIPYGSHYDHSGILWSQIECSKPFSKRLWQSVVIEKIQNQCWALTNIDSPSTRIKELEILSRRVKSGDPENMEAQAARWYWRTLFGDDFRRDLKTGMENILLNYGYSVLRAATARAVCGAGLTPALGIHHKNRKNPFSLVDDLMEPFRALVDLKVVEIIKASAEPSDTIEPDQKKLLAGILDTDVELIKGISTVSNALHRLARTFVDSLAAGENRMEFPKFKKIGTLI